MKLRAAGRSQVHLECRKRIAWNDYASIHHSAKEYVGDVWEVEIALFLFIERSTSREGDVRGSSDRRSELPSVVFSDIIADISNY